VYPGRGSEFTLYDDDGVTYDYEKGQGRLTRLHWDDERAQLTAKGAPLAGAPIAELTKVIR
jgi:alpha-D-xyloside xylohydrolase